MQRLFTLIALAALALSPLAGCGVKELGPADPEDTPQVDESEIQQEIQNSMPEQYRQQYQRSR